MLLAHGADYTVLECYGHNLTHCAAKNRSTGYLKVMTAAQLEGLDIKLDGPEGKAPGEYMENKIVMADREVGVHAAWEEFVSSLTSPQLKTNVTESATVGTRGLNLVENEKC